MLINHNACIAHNMGGRTFEGRGDTPRDAAADCLRQMRAGRSRSKLITIQAVERTETGFQFDVMGSPRWSVAAIESDIENLPQAI
jgi:hypothetical protein